MFNKQGLLMLGGVLGGMVGLCRGQVTATGTMGTTNPPQATSPTTVNQTSYARLLSVNSVDDFCLFAPPTTGSTIGDSEAFEVAWCTKPRNNARVIPDGVIQAAHFVKTPLYVQVMGWGDFTKLNIADGDYGGELDPHGATGDGNPVGGNVTSNITGTDVHYEEWMTYISYQQFCIRVCIAENSTYSASLMCQHTLDEMGCNWVMPGDYTNNSFTSCQADSAYPPGIYPEPDGSTSTFAQRYTGSYTNSGTLAYWTVGQTVTPQTPASTPASSQCTTYSTISNGLTSLNNAVAVTTTAASSGATSTSGTMSTSRASGSSGSSSGTASRSGSSSAATAAATSSAAKSSSAAMAVGRYGSDSMATTIAAGISAFALVAGAGALLL